MSHGSIWRWRTERGCIFEGVVGGERRAAGAQQQVLSRRGHFSRCKLTETDSSRPKFRCGRSRRDQLKLIASSTQIVLQHIFTSGTWIGNFISQLKSCTCLVFLISLNFIAGQWPVGVGYESRLYMQFKCWKRLAAQVCDCELSEMTSPTHWQPAARAPVNFATSFLITLCYLPILYIYILNTIALVVVGNYFDNRIVIVQCPWCVIDQNNYLKQCIFISH